MADETRDVKPNLMFLSAEEDSVLQTLPVKEKPGISSPVYGHNISFSQNLSGDASEIRNDEYCDIWGGMPVKLEVNEEEQSEQRPLLGEDGFPTLRAMLSMRSKTKREVGILDGAKQSCIGSRQNRSDLSTRKDPLCIKALRAKVQTDSSFIHKEDEGSLVTSVSLENRPGPRQSKDKYQRLAPQTLSNRINILNYDDYRQESPHANLMPHKAKSHGSIGYSPTGKGISQNKATSAKESYGVDRCASRLAAETNCQNDLQPGCDVKVDLDDRIVYFKKTNNLNLIMQLDLDVCGDNLNSGPSMEQSGLNHEHPAVQHSTHDRCKKISFIKKSPRRYICELCNRSFSTKGIIETHIKIVHLLVKQFRCDLCNKMLSRRSHLQSHMFAHLALRPYTCRICNNGFRSKYVLKKHNLTHVSERPFRCDLCNEAFKSKPSVAAHRRIHNINKTMQTFTCDICHVSYTRRDTLNKHKLTHLPWIPFTCDVCHKEFANGQTLKVHIKKIHLLKPYRCDICNTGEGFRKKSLLKQHKKVHHSVKPFTCKKCGKSFASKAHLAFHKWVHQQEKPNASSLLRTALLAKDSQI